MRCHILGALEVIGARGSVSPVARRQKIVLAMLLLEANHVVSVDRLVTAVWEEDPPVTARGQLQICISSLRHALADAGIPDVILTRTPGYLFRLGPGELDLGDFDHLVGAARADVAAGQLSAAAGSFAEALSLGDGMELTEFGSSVLDAAAVHLTERRLAALEDCVDVQLALGLHHELAGELRALVARHPLRERLRGQLMIALQRDGRQAEALEVYRQGRRMFVDELGLEPGTALQAIEQAILAGDGDVALSAVGLPAGPAPVETLPVPHMLPPDIADFVGRKTDLAEVQHAFAVDNTSEPSPRIITFTGNGGVGKTTLAVRLAHQLAPDFPDGQLYATLHGGEARPQGSCRCPRHVHAHPRRSRIQIPESADERAAMYRDRLAGRRVLVVLDDAATEDQVLPLLLSGDTAAVIVTSRVRLTRIPGACHVDIGLLSEADSMEMLERVLGPERISAEPSAAATLVELCAGMPLALRIVTARLAGRPHWTIMQLVSRLADEHRRLDELTHHNVGVRASMAVAHDRLGEGARRTFRRLGIIDAPHFGKWVVVPLLGVDQDTAEDLLESLVDVRLLDVERLGTGMWRYHFHDLVRLYAREQLAAHEPEPERTAALSRLMGAWLGLAREAHRRIYGGDYTILHSDAEAWPLPQPLLDEELADPLAWYEGERTALPAVIRHAANAGRVDVCWDIAMSAVALFETRAYLSDWRETHETALAAARYRRDCRGEAAMLYSLGALAVFQGQFAMARDRLQQAQEMLDQLADVHGSGLVQRHLGFIDRVQGNFSQALSRYDRALRALSQTGDVIGRAHVLSNLAQIRTEMGEYAEAEHLLGTAIEMARQAGCRRVEAQALDKLGGSLLESGDHPGARDAFHSVATLARDMGDLVGEAYALYGLGALHLRSGEYSHADVLLGRARRMAFDVGEHMLAGQSLLALGQMFWMTGRQAEAVRHVRIAREEFAQLSADIWLARAERSLREFLSAKDRSAAIPAAIPNAGELASIFRLPDVLA